jgi:iron complex transport system ATP-binding protein
MNEGIIRLRNFSFAFGNAPVLEQINFSLNSGETLYILGPNGAGKSSLLKSLLNLHEDGKTSGEVWIKNRPLAAYKQRDLARVMSYVPQAGGWIPPFTVEDFVRLSRYSARRPNFASGKGENADASVRAALKLTQMEEFAARPLRALSGGERQRAYVAAALAQDAEVMLLDEPASFLDPKHAHDLNQVLAKLNRDGPHGAALTTLTVTHDLNQALCAPEKTGKILVLSKGAQVYFGNAEGLLDGVILKRAFSHDFTIFKHPRTGRPAVLTS